MGADRGQGNEEILKMGSFPVGSVLRSERNRINRDKRSEGGERGRKHLRNMEMGGQFPKIVHESVWAVLDWK